MTSRIFFAAFILTTSVLMGAEAQKGNLTYSGNLHTDLLMNSFPKDSTSANPNATGKKSPYIAAGLSVALPGAGQVYAGNWWLAAGFFAAEAISVTAVLAYNNMGDKQTIFFQNYVDANISGDPNVYIARWDEVRYAEWVNAYIAQNFGDHNGVYIDPDTRKKPWERVNLAQLNAKEFEIAVSGGGTTGFSHPLAEYGTQDYYELIGKYPQFGHGWADAPNTTATQVVTPFDTYYEGERLEANQLYKAATFAVIIVILNHIASAFDAVLLTRSYNESLKIGIVPEWYADGSIGFAPTVTLSLGF